MNALKKLSFCALLSLGLFAQTVHAESFQDITDYPSWLKVNFFKHDHYLNQYIGSAIIVKEKNDFYSNYILYDDKLPPEKNAEKNRSFKGQNERLQHFRKRFNHHENAQSYC
ncbi:hypothetical protein TH0013_08240 [Helicobacter pylori]